MNTQEENHDNNSLRNGATFEQLSRNSRAIDAARQVGEEMKSVADKWGGTGVERTAGRIAETHHAGTFNVDAALKGRRDLAAVTTASQPNGGHAPSDIKILQKGNVIDEAQLKYSGDRVKTTFDLSDPKYDGMQKIAPSDQAADVRDLAKRRGSSGIEQRSYEDTASRTSDRITKEGVKSDPLSHKQAIDAAKNPAKAASDLVRGEALRAVKSGGLIGGAVGGGFSLVSNAIAVANGDKEAGDAVAAVAKDTVCGALDGAAKGGATVVAQAALVRAGARGLARGSAPVAIAVTTVDIAKDVAKCIAGEIDGAELATRTGKHAVRGGASYGGMEAGAALGTAICPGVGTIVGGVIGGFAGFLFGNWIVS